MGGMGARALQGESCRGFEAEALLGTGTVMLLGVAAHAETGSVFWRRWGRCLDFREGQPGREFGSPFECGVHRGALIFVASQRGLRKDWDKTGTWS